MNTKDVDYLCELLRPSFTPVGAKVFANETKASLRRNYARRVPRTVDENTSNSVRFRFFPDDSVDGVRQNYALAEAVSTVWEDRLRQQFPRRRFRLFVSNEYINWPTARRPFRVKAEGVETVLRLWSLPADDLGIDDVYQPDDVGRDRVCWPEYRRDGLVPLGTVIKIMKSSMVHPAKLRFMQERWHAT